MKCDLWSRLNSQVRLSRRFPYTGNQKQSDNHQYLAKVKASTAHIVSQLTLARQNARLHTCKLSFYMQFFICWRWIDPDFSMAQLSHHFHRTCSSIHLFTTCPQATLAKSSSARSDMLWEHSRTQEWTHLDWKSYHRSHGTHIVHKSL